MLLVFQSLVGSPGSGESILLQMASVASTSAQHRSVRRARETQLQHGGKVGGAGVAAGAGCGGAGGGADAY